MSYTTFNISSLTPLWTGDIEGLSKRLKQTSVVGSLRYFGESIFRNFGLYTCPIVFQGKELPKKCIYNTKKGLKSLCINCYVWGTTNWQRQYRVYLDGNIQNINFRESEKNRYLTQEKGGIFGKSPIIDILWINNGKLNFFPLNTYNFSNEFDTQEYLHLLMFVIDTFGHIGAKGRTGFGFVKVGNIDLNKVKNAINQLESIKKDTFRNESVNNLYSILPNLDHFVRLDFEIQDFSKLLYAFKYTFRFTMDLNINSAREFYLYRPSGFYIKYFLRKNLKHQFRDIFGEEKKGKGEPKQKTASFVYSSHIYQEGGKYKFRIIIEYFNEEIRNSIKEEIKALLSKSGCRFEKEYTFNSIKKGI